MRKVVSMPLGSESFGRMVRANRCVLFFQKSATRLRRLPSRTSMPQSNLRNWAQVEACTWALAPPQSLYPLPKCPQIGLHGCRPLESRRWCAVHKSWGWGKEVYRLTFVWNAHAPADCYWVYVERMLPVCPLSLAFGSWSIQGPSIAGLLGWKERFLVGDRTEWCSGWSRRDKVASFCCVGLMEAEAEVCKAGGLTLLCETHLVACFHGGS
mmetsp:Transcript_62228/g.110951  ORF Transcript_62228/g.110951 Transcript_62228/m.110951 type:complete len:211 (-) Transcript_62228:237-869(-)